MIAVPLRRCLALAAAAAAVLCLPARGEAQAPAAACDPGPITNFLAADATEPGVISLVFFGARGARVDFLECIDGSLRLLGARASAPDAATVFADATTWDCARPARRFVARATLPGGAPAAGAYSVRTGSCASRFDLRVPRRVAPGEVARVRIVDGWGIGGVTPRLCISPPHGDRTCRAVRFARAVTVRTRRFRAGARGRWRVELRIGSHHVRRSVRAGAGPAQKPSPVVLATGDSTMQGIDNFLADELADTATLRSDIRPGTGIGKSDWQAIADAQVRRHRPSATVISLGVNEGFPVTTPAGATAHCCDEPWLAEYARRVRAMMRSYRRRGAGRVVWLTLPLPRAGARAAIMSAVNGAIVRAAAGVERVTVVRMDNLFSPDGYTDVIRYRGRDVRVRTADGIHLNVSGTAIAAKVVAGVLRGR